MANPFPFVAGNVLTAAQLNGIGETTSFTPSWSGLTVGNGTLSAAKITRVNSFVLVQGTFTLGTTSAVTGNIFFANPVTPADTGQNAIGNGLFASGGVLYPITCSMAGGNIQLFPTVASGTYATTTTCTATVPFVWASGAVITWSCAYRIA
jgi:hypothetical protein